MPIDSKYNNTEAKSLQEVLASKVQFVVPKFQRNYSWNDEKVDQLWADLMENFEIYDSSTDVEEAQYLMGPVVFVKLNDGSYQVIDGQQRLATLTILFCIARDLLIELVAAQPGVTPDGLDQLKTLTENRRMGNRNSWKLTLNESDKKLFREILEYEENVTASGYKSPSDKIKEWKKDLRDKVKRNNYTESMKKIIKTYQILHDKLQTSLITNFEETEKTADEIIKKLNVSSEAETNDAIRNNPAEYGLDEHFFEIIRKLEERDFSDAEKVKLEEERERRNRTRRANPFTDLEQFLDYKLKQEMRPFNNILKTEITNLTNKNASAKRISSIPKLNTFLEHVQENNFLVQVIVDDDNDAFQIFETLNERGQPLSKSNLIKNWVIQKIGDAAAQKEISDDWNEIFDATIGEEQADDDFLRESLRSRYFDNHTLPNRTSKVKASKNNLYKIIKANVTNEQEARKYVKELKEDSDFIRLLNDPTLYPDESTKGDIFGLKNLDAKHIRTPILTAYRRWSTDDDDYKKLVKFLVKFFFRYRTVSQRHPGKLDTLMIDTAQKIHNGDNVDDIIKDLKDKDEAEDFVYHFKKSFEPKKESYAKYVLQKISISLGTPYSDVQPVDKLTLEHILPQTPDKTEWKVDDFFNDYTGDEQKKFEKFMYKLGNLTLLTQAINSKIQNKGFDKKKNYLDDNGDPAGYNSSQLEINSQTVMDKTEWTANIIEERNDYFADLAEEIWSLD